MFICSLFLLRSVKQFYCLSCYFLFHAAFKSVLPWQCFQRMKYSVSYGCCFLLVFFIFPYQALELRTSRGGQRQKRTDEQEEPVGLPTEQVPQQPLVAHRKKCIPRLSACPMDDWVFHFILHQRKDQWNKTFHPCCLMYMKTLGRYKSICLPALQAM